MQRDEILEFLTRINSFLEGKVGQGSPLKLKIIGKSALLLAGLKDSAGTVDIDLLKVESGALQANSAMESLSKEFSRQRLTVNGYRARRTSKTSARRSTRSW